MSDSKMGRPKRYHEPRQRVTLELPAELVGALDLVLADLRRKGELIDEMGTPPSRTSYIAMMLANELVIRNAAARWRGGERA